MVRFACRSKRAAPERPGRVAGALALDLITGNVTLDNKGAGVDLNSASYTRAWHNISEDNGVGITISDDLGRPSWGNEVSGNLASHDPGECGIVLAGHSGAGIFDNLVTGNLADDNGLGTPTAPNASSGSGVVLAAAGPKGGVYDNTIRLNQSIGNGHAGAVLHSQVPGARFTGDRIVENVIGRATAVTISLTAPRRAST